MTKLRMKQGESFSVDIQYMEGDGITPKSLIGVVITSQVRHNNGLVATLTVTVLDELAGTYRLSAPEGTTDWPVGTLSWDIKETVGSVIKLSDTLAISDIKAVTKL